MPLTYSWWTLHCNTVIWQITRPTAGIRAQPLVLYGEVTYTMYRLKTIWSMPISSPYHRMTTISHHCEWNITKSMFSLLHCGHSIYCLAFKSNICIKYTPQAAYEGVFTTEPTPETILRHNLRMNESSLSTDRSISGKRSEILTAGWLFTCFSTVLSMSNSRDSLYINIYIEQD